MNVLVSFLLAISTVFPTVFLPYVSSGRPENRACVYPSMAGRFGITTSSHIEEFDLTGLPAAGYLDWKVTANPSHTNNMYYLPMVRFYRTANDRPFFYPHEPDLIEWVKANPGETWVIGNEADTVWQDNLTPDRYARYYNELYTLINSLDPTAKFAFTSFATISTLRLEWLNRVWDAYQTRYSTEIPVDVWNIHTYVVNEMHNEWGAEIPTGIDNAVGYGSGAWTEISYVGASGDTVHQSRNANAKAYFAFHGSWVNLYLRTGPGSGIAEIYIDEPASPVETVDLYSPQPGALVLSYSGLQPHDDQDDPRGDRHNIRVQVTGNANPAASDNVVQVDAVEAESSATLPNGRLEDNSPLRARIVSNVDDYDNVDMIVDQIIMFRQWMADHGQRNKPLINTEYGVLMSEDLGFDYQRVSDFMLASFDRFVNDLRDPDLGYPADDNRLMQEWYWFSLAQDAFEGRSTQTGLYNQTTKQLKSLGQDYIDFVAPLVTDYIDLEAADLSLSPTWPLFAGQPSLVQIDAAVRNWGNITAPDFNIRLSNEGVPIIDQTVSGMSARYGGSDVFNLQADWQPVIEADTVVVLNSDTGNQTNDPCVNNNDLTTQLSAQLHTDLAITDLVTDPRLFPSVGATETITAPLRANLLNLGSLGTAADEVNVNFWHGDPDSGGVLIHSQTFTPTTPLPVELAFDWPGRGPGSYHVVVEVDTVAEDIDPANNRQEIDIFVPASKIFLPTVQHLAQPTLTFAPAVQPAPARSWRMIWPH